MKRVVNVSVSSDVHAVNMLTLYYVSRPVIDTPPPRRGFIARVLARARAWLDREAVFTAEDRRIARGARRVRE